MLHHIRPVPFVLAMAIVPSASAQLSVTLTPSSHNGYHVSCFGAKDGAIDLSVSGGTPPYTYDWTTGAITQDVADLASGFYGVTVTDAAMLSERKEITLTQPADMRYSAVLSDFGGYNISCNSCYNGSISITPAGGVAPYSYLWNDGATSATRSGLGAFNFSLEINDANGCADRSEVFSLSEPQRNDWTMSGNTGTTPGTQFIGTTDNKDVVFKSNNTERLRLGANGDLKMNGMVASGQRLLYVDGAGVIKAAPGPPPMASVVPWYLGGNLNVNPEDRLGPINERHLAFITHNEERMRIDTHGKLGLGMQPPSGAVASYRLYVQDGIAAGRLGTTDATDLSLTTNGIERVRIAPEGKVGVGLTPPSSPVTDFRLFVGDGIATGRVGTADATALSLMTDGQERVHITSTGKIGLGTPTPVEKFEVHHADERGGMLLNNTLPGNAHSEIRFNGGGGLRWALGSDLAADAGQDFFLWDSMAEAVRLYVKDDGRFGLGTTDPKGALHVRSPGPTRTVVSASTDAIAESWVYNSVFGYGLRVDEDGRGRFMYDFNSPQTAISLTNNGKVGIGLDPPASGSLYKLYVEGGIVCRDVKVTITQFQDMVFQPDYPLMPLADLRTYLAMHGHLPTMPKGSKVEADGGMEVGDLQMRLLRTVEEQALYILQLQEEMVRMERRVLELENR